MSEASWEGRGQVLGRTESSSHAGCWSAGSRGASYVPRERRVDRVEVPSIMDKPRRQRFVNGQQESRKGEERIPRKTRMRTQLTISHFEQASPHCLPVGGSVDLSDLQVKRE